MRLILLILFFLFLYWMVRHIVIPAILTFLAIRRQQKQFHRNYHQNQNQRESRTDGNVKMNQGKKGQSKSRIPDDEGEYIDYREVK